MDYNFARYLAAKKTVDDRALNRPVWELLTSEVTLRLNRLDRPFTVLEVGAGIGTMIERAVDWGLFAAQRHGVNYTAIDAESENIVAAHRRLVSIPPWLTLNMKGTDFFPFAADPLRQQGYDLLIANAFLDLVDVPRTLPLLRRLLRRDGLAYLTVNFDGMTLLLPTLDPQFDALVEAAYHGTMDARTVGGQASGDSWTGRNLFQTLADAGFTVLLAGSSDWLVHAVDGHYMADEADFLRFIVQTIQDALSGDPQIERERLDNWIAERHAQIDRGRLTYITHQLDFLARA